MRRYAIDAAIVAVLWLVCLVAVVRGQADIMDLPPAYHPTQCGSGPCGPGVGGCGVGVFGPRGGAVGVGVWRQPPPQAPQQAAVPHPPWAVLVRSQSSGATGCGVIIQTSGGKSLIATCEHGLNGSEQVIASDGRKFPATILWRDRARDAALLSAPFTAGQYLPVDPVPPKAGDPVSLTGCGGMRWSSRVGTVLSFGGDGKFEVDTPSIGGDSGGAVYSRVGLVGIISGTTGRTTIAASWLFAAAAHQTPSIASGPEHTPGIPPAPSTPGPEASQSAAALVAEIAGLKARVAALERKISQCPPVIAGPPGLPGPAGPAGPQGPQGLAGVPGKDAHVDYRAVADAVAKALPAIRLQTLNPDGSIRQTADARLGDLVRLKPLAVNAEAK